MLKNHKNILFSLIGIILVFFGYWYFFLSKKDTKKGQSNALVTNSTTKNSQSPANAYDKEFVANMQTVRYIDLNTEIFSKPAFKALSFPEVPFEVDYNIPVGRRNPFLPIGTDSNDRPVTETRVEAVNPVVTPVVTPAAQRGAPAPANPTLPNPQPRGR